jgi:hypothetical protein
MSKTNEVTVNPVHFVTQVFPVRLRKLSGKIHRGSRYIWNNLTVVAVEDETGIVSYRFVFEKEFYHANSKCHSHVGALKMAIARDPEWQCEWNHTHFRVTKA